MIRTKRWWLAAGLSAVALAGAACGGGDDARASGTEAEGDSAAPAGGREVKIAFMGPMTGELASIGQAARDAIRLAVDEANGRGDLPVRLRLEVFDTQFDPAQAGLLAGWRDLRLEHRRCCRAAHLGAR